jgi:hypothetical protein
VQAGGCCVRAGARRRWLLDGDAYRAHPKSSCGFDVLYLRIANYHTFGRRTARGRHVAEELLDQAFEQLPLERRERCLKASLLGDMSDRALGTFSDRTQSTLSAIFIGWDSGLYGPQELRSKSWSGAPTGKSMSASAPHLRRWLRTISRLRVCGTMRSKCWQAMRVRIEARLSGKPTP